MQNTPFTTGPKALSNTPADILNPGTTTGGVNCTGAPFDKLYLLLKSITVTDKGGAGGSFSLYIGATGGSAAGTEIAKSVAVPANSYVIIPLANRRLSQGQFLSGNAAALTTLTIVVDGEIGVGA